MKEKGERGGQSQRARKGPEGNAKWPGTRRKTEPGERHRGGKGEGKPKARSKWGEGKQGQAGRGGKEKGERAEGGRRKGKTDGKMCERGKRK